VRRALGAQLELCQTTKRQEDLAAGSADRGRRRLRHAAFGYGTPGQQTSGATPHGARTADSRDHPGFRKDLLAIWAAHRPAYAAMVIAAEPLVSAFGQQGTLVADVPMMDDQPPTSAADRVACYVAA